LDTHEAWINGQRIGDHILDPMQTDYEKRVFYVSHDVTSLLLTDGNAIGVMLGNGWYNQNKAWPEINPSYGQSKLIAQHSFCKFE